jgi:tRNA threonylcarbamoyladenosine biosynthesis protein TsaB
MALILSIETSTSVCSVAVHDAGKLIAERELHEEQVHATQLAPLIEKVRALAGVDWNKIDAIAVSSGPGSYTGLRIGVSTAKGLCYSLERPLISVSTLQTMAVQVVVGKEDLLCPMIDARRMEVFCQIFSGQAEPIRPVEAKIIDASSFAEQLKEKRVHFFGNGSSKCKDVLQSGRAIFVENIYPSAKHMGALADDQFQRKDFVDLVHFEPFYLKEFMIRKPQGNESGVNKMTV